MSATEEPEGVPVTPASRLAGYVRGGGVIVPLLTTLLAFLIGGLVMLVTGKDPIAAYEAIWKGTGLQWIFPWTTGADRDLAASNLQQTLIITTPLILTGLAVAFAFRAGLFNIGGNGQYIVGSIAAVWVGSSFADMPSFLHILLAIVAACAAGAFWAGIAGFLKATTGRARSDQHDHAQLDRRLGRHLAVLARRAASERRPEVHPGVQRRGRGREAAGVLGRSRSCRASTSGSSSRSPRQIVFWILLNRSTIGYEVRAVGFNPEAARYSGMNVGKNYILVMAVCGLFAGLAGAIDVLGWQFRIATNDIQIAYLGYIGIAVALLGRNTAVGTVAAALLFGALLSGTSQRNLDPTIFEPSLASNLT